MSMEDPVSLVVLLRSSDFSSLIEQAFSSHILEPIEELSEEEKGNKGLDQGFPVKICFMCSNASVENRSWWCPLHCVTIRSDT